MKLSITDQLNHFDSVSHEDKLQEVRWMVKIIWDAWWDLNWLDTTLETFWEYATDEDLRVIYENLLSLIKDYQDQK